MSIQSTARILIVAVTATYCLPAGWGQSTAPQTANPAAQSQPAPSQNSSPGTQADPRNLQPVAPSDSPQTAQPSQKDATVQQPVTTYPDAAGAAQTNAPPPDAPQPKAQQSTQQTEPQGAATAEKVNTAGGAAAKPAGAAIAPAKQHQSRSLLIKIGAVAAAGIAGGTIYALSRGTSSTPPGATTAGANRK